MPHRPLTRLVCSVIALSWWMGLCATAGAQTLSTALLSAGDLLFVVPAEANAITEVTQGYTDMPVDHVAACTYIGKSAATSTVIEAVPTNGVRTTTLQQFLKTHEEDIILVGRLTHEWDACATLHRLALHLGLPYDTLFLPDNEAVYCSELMTDSYITPSGEPYFPTIGMTFRSSDGQIPPYWTNLYRRNGMPVPEGMAGSNPGELSRRESIRILGQLCE